MITLRDVPQSVDDLYETLERLSGTVLADTDTACITSAEYRRHTIEIRTDDLLRVSKSLEDEGFL